MPLVYKCMNLGERGGSELAHDFGPISSVDLVPECKKMIGISVIVWSSLDVWMCSNGRRVQFLCGSAKFIAHTFRGQQKSNSSVFNQLFCNHAIYGRLHNSSHSLLATRVYVISCRDSSISHCFVDYHHDDRQIWGQLLGKLMLMSIWHMLRKYCCPSGWLSLH